MSRSSSRGALAVLLPALLSGCALGYNSMLFVTKSNIGAVAARGFGADTIKNRIMQRSSSS